MNFLDVRTVIFSHILTDTVCTLVLAVLWFQDRKRFSGLHFWMLNFILQTLAVLLIALRGIIPDWMSLGFSNILIMGGALLGYIGLTHFAGIKNLQIHNYILLIAAIALHEYFAFISPSLAGRDIIISIVLLIISFQSAWLMLYQVEGERRKQTREVGIVFALLGFVSVIRIFVILFNPSLSNDFFKIGTYDTLILITYQILLIELTFGFVLMGNRRLLADVRVQEEKFTKAFRSSPYAITLTRLEDGKILEINDGFTSITGYSHKEVLGKTTLELHLFDKEQDRTDIIKQVSKEKKIAGLEVLFRKKSGESFTGLFSSEIIEVSGEPLLLSSINDISDRKNAEEEKAFLANTIDASLNEIYICDAQTLRFRFVNQGALNNLDYTLRQMEKMTPLDIKPDFTSETYKKLVTPLIDGTESRISFETRHRRADGSLYPVEVHMQFFSQPRGGYYLEFIQDITSRKKIEEQFLKTTEELRKRNEELEQFNKAAVGRELRMIELKKEINGLSKALGKTAPYPVGSKISGGTSKK